jgi:hypothetical protein
MIIKMYKSCASISKFLYGETCASNLATITRAVVENTNTIMLLIKVSRVSWLGEDYFPLIFWLLKKLIKLVKF